MGTNTAPFSKLKENSAHMMQAGMLQQVSGNSLGRLRACNLQDPEQKHMLVHRHGASVF